MRSLEVIQQSSAKQRVDDAGYLKYALRWFRLISIGDTDVMEPCRSGIRVLNNAIIGMC